MTSGPLSLAQVGQIEEARRRGRKVRRAAWVAALSAWTIAVFAALSVAWGLLARDWWSLKLGAGMGCVAYFEFRGGRQLRRYEPRGALTLAYNQLVFGGMLVAYGLWQLVGVLRAGKSGGMSTGDPALDATVQELNYLVGSLLYGGVALLGVLGPGLTAVYYISRGRVVKRFLAETPAWVVEVLRAGV
jgi:hypothetical protein